MTLGRYRGFSLCALAFILVFFSAHHFAVPLLAVVAVRRHTIQSEFERYINKNAPAFFDVNQSKATRMAAFNRVIGTPDAIIQTPQDRLLYTVPYTNGGTSRVYSPDIPRSLYPYWVLYLAGTYSATQACAGTLASEGPLPLISGLRVLADGEIIKEIDLAHLRVISHHIYRGIDTDLTNIATGNQTAQAFNARVALDFRTLRAERPDATLFPADRYGVLGVEVDWGSQTATGVPSLISGGVYSAVSFPTAPTLQIWGKEVLDPAARAGRYWLQKYQQKVYSVSSNAQTAAAFQLPVGEVVRGILISQYTNSPRTPISTLVTATGNIVIRANGSYRKIETNFGELQKKNKADYGVAMPTGYAFLDFMDPDMGGLFGHAFRTDSGVNVVEALVDTASVANAFLQFTLVTFKPSRNFK